MIFFSRSHIKILNNFVTCSRFSFRFDVLVQALFSSADAASSAILGCFGYQIPSVSVTNLVLSNELIKVELPQRKIWKADVSSVSPSSERSVT